MTTPLRHQTPEAPAAFLRFRERVRARVGTAELLTFEAGGERFAFDLRAVDEIIDAPSLQDVPDAPPQMVGVCALRGRTIPVFGSSHVLGVPTGSASAVLVMRNGDRRLGLLVDDVDDVVTVELCDLRDAPWEGQDDMLLGVLWRDGALTSILDARSLVAACTAAATVPAI
jgi:purine-binding chemotaxis protein CheW